MTAALFYPLSLMVWRSFSDPELGFQHYLRLAEQPVYLRITLTTLEVSAIVTLACLLIGYPVAYAASNRGPRMRLILLATVMMPFWTSLLVRTYAFMVILGQGGPFTSLFDILAWQEPPRLIYNRFGAILGMIYVMLPFMVMTIFAVTSEIDANYRKAARSLGAGPWRAFTDVYLPQSYPGITGGVLLVFIVSIGFYVTPALLGGRKETFIAQVIQLNVQEIINWGFAAGLAVVLLIVTMTLLLVYDRLLGHESVMRPRGVGSE